MPTPPQKSKDIIIRDKDGSFKVLRDGKFVSLQQAGDKQVPVASTIVAPTKPASVAQTAQQKSDASAYANDTNARMRALLKGSSPATAPRPATPARSVAPRPQSTPRPAAVSVPKPMSSPTISKQDVALPPPPPRPSSATTSPRPIINRPAPSTAPRGFSSAPRPVTNRSTVVPARAINQSPIPKNDTPITKKPVTPVKPMNPEPVLTAGSTIAAYDDPQTIKKAEAALQAAGVMFPSKEIRQRTIKCLVSHLKGVRRPNVTKECLMKPLSEGGSAIDDADAEKIIRALTGESVSATTGIKINQSANPTQSVAVSGSPKRDITPPSKLDLDFSQMPTLTGMVPAKTAPFKNVVAPKPSFADISKPVTPTISPIQELSYDIMTWRRLADNPQDRMTKIDNQLGVLERERYPKRLQGIQSWRNSEVFRVYVDAGLAAFEQSKPIEEILAKGPISVEEWQSVAQFNSRLRF